MEHFTYSDISEDNKHLKQGDIFKRTEALDAIISDVHKHYLKSDYLYFIVLTQSCDLVRRKKDKCKSPYITIAAIRSLELLLSREIRKKQKTDLEIKANLLPEEHREDLYRFLERLFNNNEPEYFYLHENPSINFRSCVAFLRLSIPIKSDLHYDTCLDARLLELHDNFKSKLGWLVGNMYSRVGTEDWVPNTLTEDSFKFWINKTLDDSCFFVDEKKYKELNNIFKKEELPTLSEKEILERITGYPIKQKQELLIESLDKIIEKRSIIADPEVKNKFFNFIKNDKIISAILRD